MMQSKEKHWLPVYAWDQTSNEHYNHCCMHKICIFPIWLPHPNPLDTMNFFPNFFPTNNLRDENDFVVTLSRTRELRFYQIQRKTIMEKSFCWSDENGPAKRFFHTRLYANQPSMYHSLLKSYRSKQFVFIVRNTCIYVFMEIILLVHFHPTSKMIFSLCSIHV